MLNLTPKEIVERKALRVNPCKTCQPAGAIYCALGVHKCMPHSHGSQGCVSYHRSILARHFKEPAVATTSSFSEGACVFGGGSNVKTAVKNIFDLYNPDIIACHTTCLSETIGDDLNTYIQQMDIPEGKLVIHSNTPSYVGSHVNGFFNMMAGFIEYLAEESDTCNGKIGIFPGFVNPGDMREMKRIAGLVKADYIMFPDTSGVMDAPITGRYDMYPKGGTTLADIKKLGAVRRVIALGEVTEQEPCMVLKRKCSVESEIMPLPIGINNTDEYIMALTRLTNAQVPYSLEEERGQIVDVMLDSSSFVFAKKAAIYGDPDTVLGIAALVLEMGMIPKYMLTGTPMDSFTKKAKILLDKYGVADKCKVKAAGDLFELHQWIKNETVDILIGTTYGKQIAKAEDIPLVRAGFPVLDRHAHALQPIVGYKGALRLVEMILNAILDKEDRICADEDLEIVQ